MKKLLTANLLDKIPYLASPNSDQVIYLTPTELEKKLGFCYDESLYGDFSKLQGYLNNPEFCQELVSQPDVPKEQAIRARLKNPMQDVAICNYGLELGHGLCALKDIPAHTVLFLYAGDIDRSYANHDDYAYKWVSLDNNAPTQVISAKAKGGLARFMAHLPLDREKSKAILIQSLEQQFGPLMRQKRIDVNQFADKISQLFDDNDRELENIQFFETETRKSLATSNVNTKHTAIDNIPIAVCSAICHIKKGEPVGMSYGWQY